MTGVATQATPTGRHAIAHVREFLGDSVTPLALYRRLAELSPVRFLLESVTGGEQVSRFSFLGAAPRKLYRLYPDRLEVQDTGAGSGDRVRLPGVPLAALERVLGSVRSGDGPVPFAGGFVGFFGYDLIRLIETLPNRPPDPFDLPVAVIGRFDTVLAVDHARQRVLAVANEIEGEVSQEQANADLDRMAELLRGGVTEHAASMPRGTIVAADLGPASLSGEQYRAAVERAKEHIAAGDIFQVVLARRWKTRDAPAPLLLYRALRAVNPSPYMVLLELPDVALVGASPEMLVRKSGRRAETRPIAGTRPRGQDAESDRALAADLLADEKERAEHVMLVDLGRNDLGRVATAGGVKVETFMEIERYSHVMHIVSSVAAELPEKTTALDALLACFPAGTVSGAPKIRAMQIIDTLEPEARGPYAGAVGYASFSGDLDTCITIRTLVVRNGETSVTAGAGIVADSDPATEERETENKAAALLQAVALARALEAEER
ncbi:MAG: anthranilate synthase component I family protein [Acidobacteriota bacterium]